MKKSLINIVFKFLDFTRVLLIAILTLFITQTFNTVTHPILNKYISPIHKHKTLYLDPDLSFNEAFLVVEAAQHWTKRTKGLVKFDIKLTPSNKDLIFANPNESVAITTISSSSSDVKFLDIKNENSTLAFYTTRYPLPTIVLIPERIEDEEGYYDDNYYRTVIIHEIGHAIGLDHVSTTENSIMYPTAGEDGPFFLTDADMKNFCLVYYCSPEQLKSQ